jgi:hypothetical protein
MMAKLFRRTKDNEEALERMASDPDLQAEAQVLPPGHPPVTALADKQVGGAVSCPMAKLSVVRQSHKGNDATAAIVHSIGGIAVLRRFTTNFYKKAFDDPHLDSFIRSHTDPHGERFATWIAEKLGAGTPWSQERRTRDIHNFEAKGEWFQTPHDRSSAHFAAWHSPKRDDNVWGEHFKLDTCRVWMRLHFWAMREEGLTDHAAFTDYYVRFIGHFVSVYEGSAPPFARESLRWSADPTNIQAYRDARNRMPDIMGLSKTAALATLPAEERIYTGSVAASHWPYEQR